MKSVMISIQPWWCMQIANGKKTVEVRKNKPNIPPPFKCYIYCTNARPLIAYADVMKGDWVNECTTITGRSREEAESIFDIMNGKVIGEFVCDNISKLDALELCNDETVRRKAEGSCLLVDAIRDYAGWNENYKPWQLRDLYLWHIDGLEIYDEPKSLGSFRRYSTENPCDNGMRCVNKYYDEQERVNACLIDFYGHNCPMMKITKAPQSWCYVEQLPTSHGE